MSDLEDLEREFNPVDLYVIKKNKLYKRPKNARSTRSARSKIYNDGSIKTKDEAPKK